ncbi:snRNA-activating protein complex subunit 2 isoform X1 [Limanda limanda]|uniref:snRNA-activating protein complex subunit 2 isoform X1 n=1 Tax=Limanda limanda TaxID=27771 RepID=UPI0029C8BB2E|nr:snRNA-activating protein complex subunit 2 isoform X1 [Limanda limanda]
MKPPPRTRMKPGRIRTPDGSPLESGKVSQNWKRFERSNLLKALETLSKTTGGQGDIDYAALRKQVPTRSVAEIHAVVEGLKDKAICSASFYLKNKDKMVRKPIEMWTHMALAVTGTLNDPICSAFAQMLIVSSTEPRTLRNCDPPQDIRLSTAAGRRLGCSIPQRRMLRLSGKGKRDGTNTPHPFVVFKTPAPTIGRARRLPLSSNVVRLPNNRIPPPQQQPSNPAGTRPADTCSSPTAVTFHAAGRAEVLLPPITPQLVSQIVIPATTCSNTTSEVKTVNVESIVKQPTQQLSKLKPSTISTLKSTSSRPDMPLASSATRLTPFPSTAPSSVKSSISATSNHPVAPLSTPAAALPSSVGCVSKSATKKTIFDVNCNVDFERIYHYMSAMHEADDMRPLTPMESAIVLDLLMSLPEELSLLPCTKLHKHLIQMYQRLSSPANSMEGRELFKDLQDGLSAQTGGQDMPACQQNTAQTFDSSGVQDSEEPKVAESQSSGTNNSSIQPGKDNEMGFTPLNPFSVPLQLLMRR